MRAVLEDLERNQKMFYRNICDETGTVRRHLNVFVNSDNCTQTSTGSTHRWRPETW